VLEYEESIQVRTSCKDLIIRNVSCYAISIELWGIKSHSTGLYLAYKAESKQTGASMSMTHPCVENGILHIPCDGQIRYQRISKLDNCINITDNTMVNKLAYYVEKHHESLNQVSNFPNIVSYS